MDLLALQADWVDDYCSEEEQIGEDEQEEKRKKSVADNKKSLPSSSIYMEGYSSAQQIFTPLQESSSIRRPKHAQYRSMTDSKLDISK